ncbi:MAG: hypothetical protein GC151_00070 [Betaproteobacteria bacterium]|nr:hypothetical protein [Betaproteobacteria bacterium]
MKFWKVGLAVMGLGLASSTAFADDWSTLNSWENVEVNAPAITAWAIVSRWDALDSWCPAFVKTEIKSGGTEPGAVRAITLKDGPTFTEQLLSVDKDGTDGYSYTYKIVESPLPIVDYVSKVRVIPYGDDKSVIDWQGSYKRRAKDNPTKDNDDAAVMKIVTGLYKACLANAKHMAESR